MGKNTSTGGFAGIRFPSPRCATWAPAAGNVKRRRGAAGTADGEKAERVKGRWKYLYRAIDKGGATLDCFLADRRNAEAAKRFLSAALKRSRDWIPRVINTDKNPA